MLVKGAPDVRKALNQSTITCLSIPTYEKATILFSYQKFLYRNYFGFYIYGTSIPLYEIMRP